jgi:hypothetical protein
LKPNNLYNIRIIAVNANNFTAPSRLIRLRTEGRRQSRSDSSSGLISDDHDGGLLDDSSDEAPAILVHGPGSESPHIPNIQTREAATGGPTGRRLTVGRRPSPAGQAHEFSPSPSSGLISGHDTSDKTQDELNVELDAVRRDVEETRLQIVQAEEEHNTTLINLTDERDRLRQENKAKEDMSTDLRKELSALEQQNRIAQGRRSKKEKALKDKESERKKMESDMLKWDDEITKLDEDLKRSEQKKLSCHAKAQDEVSRAKEELREKQKSVKSLEEKVKTTGALIKSLEDERQDGQVGDEVDEAREHEKAEKIKEDQWRREYDEAFMTYHRAYEAMQMVSSLFSRDMTASNSCHISWNTTVHRYINSFSTGRLAALVTRLPSQGFLLLTTIFLRRPPRANQKHVAAVNANHLELGTRLRQ